MTELIRDVRLGVRSLARSGSFGALTIVTLGVGIGVITALFAIVDAVVLEPIVADQDRVVRVSKIDTQRGGFPLALSFPEFIAWRDQSHDLEVVAAVDHAATGRQAIAIDGELSAVTLAPVSGDFFRVVHRGAPLHGRWFDRSDDTPGGEAVAIISERLWRRASGGDPAFVGRRLSWAGSRTLRVVGIAPAAIDYPLGTDIWVPAMTVFDGQSGRFDATNRAFSQFELVGRLAPGVSLDQVSAELTVIHDRVAAAFPDNGQGTTVVVEPLLDTVVASSRRVLLALLAAATLVFITAGVNVAALLLMRASGRRADVAIRLALGARFGRLLRQSLAEGLVLGSCAAACGLVVARGILSGVLWLAPGDVPRIEQATLDLRVLAFCVAVALVWVVTLGTAPLWSHRRLARVPDVGRSFKTVGGTRGLQVFTIAEIAAAVVVTIGAGLLLRTFGYLQAIDRGFEAKNLLTISLLLPEERQRDPRAMVAFYEQLLPRIGALPGVQAATPIHVLPGSGTLGLSAPMRFEGQTAEEAATNPWATWEPVLPSYFETLGIPIVRGRSFTTADRRDGAPVAIVSESVARRYWPGQDPIGKRLQFVAAADWPWVTVVGVVRDTRYRELTKPWMTAYFPADQFFFFRASSLVVRTAAAADALVPAIVQTIRTLEPGATIEGAAAMDTLLARELARPRTSASVIFVFALIAIVLAAVGVYGVMSYDVRQRRRELAVRSAIGAAPTDIFRSVLRRSLIVGAAGAASGLLLATSATRALRSLLYGVEPLDASVFVTGATLLLVVVLIAAWLPARRAARADAVAALRAE